MTGIELDCALPPPDLTSHFSLLYRLAIDLSIADHPIPAAGAQLRIHFGQDRSAGTLPSADDAMARHGTVSLAPPTTRATRVDSVAPRRVFAAVLTPLGWAAMLGGRIPALSVAFDPAAGLATMAAAIVPQLRGAMTHPDPATASFVAAVDAWLAEPSPDIARLIAVTGLSRRQVERRCTRLYGGPPVMLARKDRALRAAVSLADGMTSLDVLAASDFYDQSHLVRELKRFTGLTPGQLRDGAGLLLRPTMPIGGNLAQPRMRRTG